MMCLRRLGDAVVCCAVLGIILVPERATAQEEENFTELLDFHRDLVAAMRLRNDTALFAAVALENYLVIPPGGVIETREQALRGISNFDADSVKVQIEMVARHDSTAVLVGTVAGNTRVRGPVPQFGKVRFMAVYVRTAGAWRLLAQSTTPCHERAIQAGRC